MNKNDILKGLTEAHQSLADVNDILKRITLSEILDKDTQDERDNTVTISQTIENLKNELIEIETQILRK